MITDRADAMIRYMETLRIPEGKDVGKPFVLRPWQREIIQQVYGPVDDSGKRLCRVAVYSVPKKNGKGLALDTPIPTPTGWTTMGGVSIGDILYDEQGNECKVLMASDIKNIDCYEVEFSNGDRIVCDSEHLWTTSTLQGRPRNGDRSKNSTIKTRPIVEIFETQTYGKACNHSIDMASPISGRRNGLPVDPYVLGVWLGDGESGSARVSCGDQDVDEIVRNLAECGIDTSKKRDKSCWRVTLSHGRGGKETKINTHLRGMGLLNNKHIPSSYLRATVSQRISLLQGLMDTDGTCDRLGRSQEFSTTKENMAKTFCELLSSLGIKYRHRTKKMRCNGVDVDGISNVIQFHALKDYIPVFRLKRKLDRQKTSSDRVMSSRSTTVQIKRVRKVSTVPTRCIGVDSPNNLFLCGKTMIPTHNTPFVAGLCLGHLHGPEAKTNEQIYSAAYDRDQAKIVFEYMRQMIEMDEELSDEIVIKASTKELTCRATGSRYKALSSEVKGKHGLGPAVIVFDELAQFGTDRIFYDTLMQGRGAHDEPLAWIISTQSPDDKAVLSELIDYGAKVNAGEIADPTFRCFLWQAPGDADPHDEETWKACNPALGDFLSIDDMREASRTAKNMPSAEANFRNLRLNQRIDASAHFISPSVWRACGGEVDQSVFEDVECYGGLDLSGKNDLTALVFTAEDDDGVIHALSYFWTPGDGLRERERRDRAPYCTWRDQGYLEAKPGKTIDYGWVARKLAKLSGILKIAWMRFDRWRIADLQRELVDAGVDCWIEGIDWTPGDKGPMPYGLRLIPHGQGFKDMNPAVERLEDILIEGRLRHGGHPVLTYCMSNIRVQSDPAGNRKFDKLKSTGRIDGGVALAMAITKPSDKDQVEIEDGVVVL